MDRDQTALLGFSFLFFLLIPDFCGSHSPSQVLTLKCDGLSFETKTPLPFNFTGGACSANDNYLMLCFSKENNKLCYKSKSPIPEYWWQFTLTRESIFEHYSTAIALSSYNASGIQIAKYGDLKF